MDIDRDVIRKIVEEVVRQQIGSGSAPRSVEVPVASGRYGIFTSADDAVAAAGESYKAWFSMSLETKAACVQAMRDVSLAQARPMAELAHAETGLGRVEDKVNKNLLQVAKTPGLEDVKPQVFTGDRGLTLVEKAPFGVICSVTPTTNPVATIINNSISMVSGGNAVVFNPHPRAKGCCNQMIQLLNQAIHKAGGPPTLLTSVAEPTIETSQALMKHKGVRCLVVTGGPGVVAQAMASGKKTIAAGPGNPPVVVDETADLRQAARDTVAGSSFDNNVMCTCEKEVFIVDSVFREFKEHMLNNGCYELTPRQLDELTRVIFQPPPVGSTKTVLNRDLIGQHASDIARTIGLDLPRDTRLLIAETPFEHPLVLKEQMMPVLPLVRCRDVNEAIERAVQAEGGRYHTAVMHSRNIENLSRMARVVNANIFIKNGPNYAGLGFGGEGFTTMTIAGTTGEGVTSARTFTRERRCALIDYFRILG
ncbi:MAG: aldehyde dehydrogenase family protein [Vulcanimicrobiota bacterium]